MSSAGVFSSLCRYDLMSQWTNELGRSKLFHLVLWFMISKSMGRENRSIKHPPLLVPGHTLQCYPSTSFHGKQGKACQYFTGLRKAAMSLLGELCNWKRKSLPMKSPAKESHRRYFCKRLLAKYLINKDGWQWPILLLRWLKCSHQYLFSFAPNFLEKEKKETYFDLKFSMFHLSPKVT